MAATARQPDANAKDVERWLRDQVRAGRLKRQLSLDTLQSIAAILANVANGHVSRVSYLSKQRRRIVAGAAKEVLRNKRA